jgi:hypothetical protein
MSVIQNQQTDLLSFISINNIEITNHNRKHSLTEDLYVTDTESAGGRIRRFYKQNKKTLSVSLSYLPGNTDKTVDGRAGRDFLYNLALNAPHVFVVYRDKPGDSSISFNAFISNYREVIVRRDLPTQCIYYNVEFEIEEA